MEVNSGHTPKQNVIWTLSMVVFMGGSTIYMTSDNVGIISENPWRFKQPNANL